MPSLTLLSRRSDLAVIQAESVRRALIRRWPDLDVRLATRASTGDRDRRMSLATAADKGVFTSDLTEALIGGEASAVVHSWKDLPLESRHETVVAGTLERADPRDVLLVRREALAARPDTLRVLTSSPRRAWQARESLAALLPWPVVSIETEEVRGNVPTRLATLLAGGGDALVVAKAALDRLLSDEAPAGIVARIRDLLTGCLWMVLPIRDFPTAPAQGALAIEVARDRADLVERVAAVSHAPTQAAVDLERAVLAGHGGGCHLSLGATVLIRPYGRIRSVRGQVGDGDPIAEWSLSADQELPPPVAASAIWPRPDERESAVRRPLDVRVPDNAGGYWVARADALPADLRPDPSTPVWAAGLRTWQKLAARGIWVYGSAEGLGDEEPPHIDRLVGRPVEWLRLTHRDAEAPDALATYAVDWTLPSGLTARTHFFWTSGVLFRRTLDTHPQLAGAWHAAGPGRTGREVRDRLGPSGRVSIWLDYDQWHEHVTR